MVVRKCHQANIGEYISLGSLVYKILLCQNKLGIAAVDWATKLN